MLTGVHRGIIIGKSMRLRWTTQVFKMRCYTDESMIFFIRRFFLFGTMWHKKHMGRTGESYGRNIDGPYTMYCTVCSMQYIIYPNRILKWTIYMYIVSFEYSMRENGVWRASKVLKFPATSYMREKPEAQTPANIFLFQNFCFCGDHSVCFWCFCLCYSN